MKTTIEVPKPSEERGDVGIRFQFPAARKRHGSFSNY